MQSEAREGRAEPYESSIEHLLCELARVDVLIRGCVELAREKGPRDDPYRGLYISESNVDALLSSPMGLPPWAESRSAETREALGLIQRTNALRLAATETRGGALRLFELRRLFGLNGLDQDILLLCLAPELNLKYELLFAYLQDDVTRRRPSVDLALNVLSSSFAEKLAIRARFGTGAPLLREGLIELFDDPAAVKPSSLAKCLRLDPRIVDYLLASDAIDQRLRRYVLRIETQRVDHSGSDCRELHQFVDRAARLYRGAGRLSLHLHGRDESLRRRWAEALCRRLGQTLLAVDCAALGGDDDAPRMIDLVSREAALLRAAVFWDDFECFDLDGRRGTRRRLMEMLSSHMGLSFVAGASPRAPDCADGDMPISILVSTPSTHERIRIWQRALADAMTPEVAAEIPALAAKFRFSEDKIMAAASSARSRGQWRGSGSPRITGGELGACCRDQSRAKLDQLAHKTLPQQSWSDLVLPDDSLRQLREICDRVQFRSQVMEAWGFERKLSLGRGLSVLFSGPSGVGKTMAAEIMANELGFDLYKIDLSLVVNKYIGETEKNLSRVFAEAEDSCAILFFDEADALFGKRSEVQDARDRYANVETSYLLQRMEEYDGVSILATNLRRNMDEAFIRRIAYIVQFPMPEAEQRLLIWRGAFPETTPIAEDVDLVSLAERFRLSGASIKSIAIAGAYFAASEGRHVSMSHLIRATRRELQKLGKSVSQAEFGEFAHMLADG